ncbi:hypothetical protein [Bacillus mycoides]|uniref:Uncharacterized protein n=1 Tax=Bacillus mycoides (strain KBAB4) TaxID=315730 RepID=A9VVJ9_BACMK|nr:hypothetical protein [Bacillus mycoides]ABY46814.1 hypothetical protein BcerKBAB4_5320 [Bacillus mycoides KBAB4]
MAVKQHSFKCNTTNPDEKMINDFLEGKPTQYHVIEAMKVYVRMENAKQTAIDNMISSIETGLFSQGNREQGTETKPPKSSNDDIEEFEL